MSESEPRVVSIFRFVSVHLLQNVLGILRSKSIALLWGASGIGILGQVTTFYSFQTKLLMFGITAALVNSVNEAGKKRWSKDEVRFCNFLIVLLMNVIFLAVLLANPGGWAELVFADSQYQHLMLLLGGLGVIYSFAMFLELNFQANLDYRTLALGRSISFGVGLLFIVPLVYWWNVAGVILDLMIVFITSILFFGVRTGKKKLWSYIRFRKPDFKILSYVWRVSRYDVARSVAVIGALLITRIYILHSLGEVRNGYFQSIWAISNYVDVVLQGFMVYFYPAITKTLNEKDLRQELTANFQLLVYMILPILTVLIIFPEIFLVILFSSDFAHLGSLLALAALGKVFNFFYFFYSIIFLGKSYLRLFLSLEVLRGLSLIGLSITLVGDFDLTGAVWAFLVTDLICISFVLLTLWRIPVLRLPKDTAWLYTKLILFVLLIYLMPFGWAIKSAVAIIMCFLFFDMKKYQSLFQQILLRVRG